MAVPDSLEKLVEDGVIDEIQQRLMSGKEASVYVVSRRGEIIAAKVYKARDRRTFKSTSSYTEGRNQTRNTRDTRAMERRSSYGKELMEDSWRDMEYRALFDAHHAGVRVPKPIMIYEDVLLMELLVDENDAPAPRLADFDLTAEEAGAMLNEVYRQVRLLLGTGRIHGDLSAFNILMAAGGPTIIDLPQVVDAAGNNQAREILKRDLRNVVEHLARFDERLLRFVDCGDVLFQHFVRGTLEEATEPREVRREYSGGRRMRGEERADGTVGQARRGPPQHGRGPQHPQQGHPQQGHPQQGRGPQHPQQGRGPQHSGPNGPQQGRGPQHPPQGRGPQHPQQGRGPQHPQPSDLQHERGPRGPQQGQGPRNGPPQDRGRGPQQGPPQQGQGRQGQDRGYQGRGPQEGHRGSPPGRSPQGQPPPHGQSQHGPGRRPEDGGGPQHGQRQGPPQERAPNRFDARPRNGPSNGPRDPRDRPPVEVDVIRRRPGPKP